MSIESEEDLTAAPPPNNTNNNCEDSNDTVNSSEDEATLRTNYYCNKNNKNSTECKKMNLNKNIDVSTNTAGNKKPNSDTPTSNNHSDEVTVVEEEEEQQSSPDPKVPSSPTEDALTGNENSPMDITVELQEDIIFEAESLLPNDILSKLKAQVRTLKRSDLETLIMDKILQAIATHSDVGVLSQKLIQSNLQRDRLFYKISNLQRQVAELQKAVRSVSENVGRNQWTTRQPANQPIRFYRSVGVQAVLESPLSSGRNLEQTQTIEDSPNSILKPRNNTATTTTPLKNKYGTINKARPSPTSKPVLSSPATASALVFGGSVNPGLKRVIKNPALTLSEMSKQVESQVQAQAKIRRVGSDNGITTMVMSNGNILNGVTAAEGSTPVNSNATTAPNQVRQPPALYQIRNPAAAAANKALHAMSNNSNNDHGVVDLTDDDDPPMINIAKGTVLPGANTSLKVNGGTASNVVLQPQGVQQHLLIRPGQPLQFIQDGKSYYQLVTPAGASSNRPVFMSTTNLQRPTQIRPTAGAAPNQILRASGVQTSSAQSTAMAPRSIVNNPGQLVMSGFPATGRPPLSAFAPTMVSKQQQMNLNASRPGGVTINAAQPLTQKTCANGTGTGSRVMIPPQMRFVGGATLTKVVTRTPIETARNKFVLPPLPPPAITGQPGRCSKDIPPRPELTLIEQNEGIVLSWTLKLGSDHSEIRTYQIYACQESLSNNQKAAVWTRVGDVKALPLPMACTLSQFTDQNRYHFIVRGVDVYNRTGPFCEASAITLKRKS